VKRKKGAARKLSSSEQAQSVKGNGARFRCVILHGIAHLASPRSRSYSASVPDMRSASGNLECAAGTTTVIEPGGLSLDPHQCLCVAKGP